MPKFLLCVCVNPRESEKWESSSDFNGNLRPAETVSSIAKLYWFSALFVLCQKARTCGVNPRGWTGGGWLD